MCIAEVATARGVAAALWAYSSPGESSLLPCVGVPKTRDAKDFSKASANALHTTHGVWVILGPAYPYHITEMLPSS